MRLMRGSAETCPRIRSAVASSQHPHSASFVRTVRRMSWIVQFVTPHALSNLILFFPHAQNGPPAAVGKKYSEFPILGIDASSALIRFGSTNSPPFFSLLTSAG